MLVLVEIFDLLVEGFSGRRGPYALSFICATVLNDGRSSNVLDASEMTTSPMRSTFLRRRPRCSVRSGGVYGVRYTTVYGLGSLCPLN